MTSMLMVGSIRVLQVLIHSEIAIEKSFVWEKAVQAIANANWVIFQQQV